MSEPDAGATPSRRAETLWLAAALVVFAVLATRYNLVRSMWLDEYFTWSRTGGTLAETVEQALYTSTKPPVYFLVVHWWRWLSDSIEWIRVVSTLSILGSLVALHRLSRALAIPADWRSVALLGAFTPHFLYVGAEARGYALCLLFLSWATYWWARVWVAESARPGLATAGFVAASYLAMLTFYYAGFVVAGLLLAGFLFPERRVLAFRAGAALTALMIPWLPVVAAQVAGQSTYLDPIATDSEPVGAVASTGRYLATQLLATVFRLSPIQGRPWFATAVAAGLVAVVALRLGLGRPRWTRVESKALLAVLVPVGLLLAVRTANKVHADVRHWVVVVPGLLLMPALLASRVRPRRVAEALAAALLAGFAASAISFARNERGSYDFKAAARAIEAGEQPGEPIVSFDNNPGPFLYYYHGPNPVRRLPADLSIARGTYPFTPEEAERLRVFLGHAAPPARRFWIFEKGFESPRFQRAAEVIDRYHPDSVAVEQMDRLYRIRVVKARLMARAESEP